MNQYWITADGNFRNKIQWNLNKSSYICSREYPLKILSAKCPPYCSNLHVSISTIGLWYHLITRHNVTLPGHEYTAKSTMMDVHEWNRINQQHTADSRCLAAVDSGYLPRVEWTWQRMGQGQNDMPSHTCNSLSSDDLRSWSESQLCLGHCFCLSLVIYHVQ